MNPNFSDINVEDNLKNSDSVFNFYKTLISFRKKSKDLVYADYEDLDPDHPQVFCYQRVGRKQTYLIILNFSDTQVNYKIPVFNPKNHLIISNNKNKISCIKSNYIDLEPWDALMIKF